MRYLAIALLFGVLVLPGLASAQYYVDMDMEASSYNLQTGDEVCVTICFDHNVMWRPEARLEVYVTYPSGAEVLWYENDFVFPRQAFCCQECYTVPNCGEFGEFVVTGYLYYQGNVVAQDSFTLMINP